jgi:hypothetical protein
VENLRDGLPFADAVDEALHETSMNSAAGSEKTPVGEPEKQVRDLLSLMTPGYPAEIHDADHALALIHEVMAIRHVGAADRGRALKDLLGKLRAKLEGTEDRFLFPVLRNAAERAVYEPHLAPWALTDSELVGVYKAVEGSSELLGDVSAATAPAGLISLPAGLVSLAAGLGSRQQASFRKAYERELQRRGFLKRPGE